jgi:thiamine biosynthesis lipoprotein
MRRCRPLLGTFVEIDCDVAQAVAAGFAAIERIHALMSAHEKDSELSRVNRLAHLGPVAISDDTAEVLRRALDWSRASNGVFDVVRAGARALANGDLPRHDGQPLPDPLTDWTAIHLDAGAVSLTASACLDLGGIAKGYAVDAAVRAMRDQGAVAGLVNAGGDMRAFGPRTWRVTLAEPSTRRGFIELDLADQALATSAGLRGSDGLSFAHLGARRGEWASVTVCAPSACDADALTKIVWALGRRSSRLLDGADSCAFAIGSRGSLEPIGDRALAA